MQQMENIVIWIFWGVRKESEVQRLVSNLRSCLSASKRSFSVVYRVYSTPHSRNCEWREIVHVKVDCAAPREGFLSILSRVESWKGVSLNWEGKLDRIHLWEMEPITTNQNQRCGTASEQNPIYGTPRVLGSNKSQSLNTQSEGAVRSDVKNPRVGNQFVIQYQISTSTLLSLS